MDGVKILSEPKESPRAVLLCFHWAGGNALSFRDVAKSVATEGIIVFAASLPFRSAVNTGAPIPSASVSDHVNYVVASLLSFPRWKEFSSLPLLVYGHSYGALIAYEACLVLEPKPVKILVSGCPSPRELVRHNHRLRETQTAKHLMADRELCSYVQSLQGRVGFAVTSSLSPSPLIFLSLSLSSSGAGARGIHTARPAAHPARLPRLRVLPPRAARAHAAAAGGGVAAGRPRGQRGAVQGLAGLQQRAWRQGCARDENPRALLPHGERWPRRAGGAAAGPAARVAGVGVGVHSSVGVVICLYRDCHVMTVRGAHNEYHSQLRKASSSMRVSASYSTDVHRK